MSTARSARQGTTATSPDRRSRHLCRGDDVIWSRSAPGRNGRDVVISLQQLGKHYGGRTLFEGVSLQLNAGSRYGLVGANGSGKTTLLRILCGDEAASDGSVSMAKNTRLGVLRQDQFLADDKNVIDVVMAGDREAVAALDAKDTDRIAALD